MKEYCDDANHGNLARMLCPVSCQVDLRECMARRSNTSHALDQDLMGHPGAALRTTTQAHSAPTQAHSAPTQAHSAPTQDHSAPTQAHSAPTQDHSAPASMRRTTGGDQCAIPCHTERWNYCGKLGVSSGPRAQKEGESLRETSEMPTLISL